MTLRYYLLCFYLYLSVGLLSGCGSESHSSQSASDIENSQVAQSQSGDAISGKEVRVDKSTNIVIYQQTPVEYAQRFEQRHQSGMTDFERGMIWIGSLLLGSMISLAFISFLYHSLTDTSSRKAFIADLRSGMRRRLYRKVVKRLLRFLRRFYGRELSWRAFSVSLLLAYMYPLLLFVLAYSYFGGSAVFSGKPLFPIDTEWRGVYFPALLLFGWVAYWGMKFLMGNSDFLDAWGVRQLRRFSRLSKAIAEQVWKVSMGVLAGAISWFFLQPESVGWLVFWAGFGYLSGAVAVAVAVAGAGAVAVAVAGAGAGAGAVAVAVAVAGAVAVAVAGAVAGAGAGAVAVAFAGAGAALNIIIGNYENSLLFAFFYLMLPLLNACLDFLSWWVSRQFLKLTLVTKRFWLVVVEVIVDAGIGGLFLLILCLLLPPLAIGLDSFYSFWSNEQGFSAHTGWQNLAYAAARDPRGEGLLVTGMLLSTLIPTALHLIFGTSAFLVYGLFGEALAGVVENSPEGARFRYFLVSVWMYAYILLAAAILAGILWLLYQLWQMPIAEMLYEFVFYWYSGYGMVPLP